MPTCCLEPLTYSKGEVIVQKIAAHGISVKAMKLRNRLKRRAAWEMFYLVLGAFLWQAHLVGSMFWLYMLLLFDAQ